MLLCCWHEHSWCTRIDPSPSEAAWAPTTLGVLERVKRLRALWETETPRTAPGNWWLVQLHSVKFHRETQLRRRGTHGLEMLLGSSMLVLVPRQEKTTPTSLLRNTDNFTGKRSHFPDLSAGNQTDVSGLSSSEHHGPPYCQPSRSPHAQPSDCLMWSLSGRSSDVIDGGLFYLNSRSHSREARTNLLTANSFSRRRLNRRLWKQAEVSGSSRRSGSQG